ncbi:Hypothetical protein A7982_01988 [Minicystis rosea]|nr:Hypothetical protein A7982_01988 [Minicystis rosea]
MDIQRRVSLRDAARVLGLVRHMLAIADDGGLHRSFSAGSITIQGARQPPSTPTLRVFCPACRHHRSMSCSVAALPTSCGAARFNR